MGRPLKFDPEITRQRIMETFWAKGYEATSIADLMAATGLKKGSLYKSYGNKSDMFLLALAAYDRVAVEASAQMMDAMPGRQALVAFLALPSLAVKKGDRKGCLLCNSLSEYTWLDAAAQAHVSASRGIMLAAIERALVCAGQVDGTAQKAAHLLAVYFGQRVMARGGARASTLATISEMTLGEGLKLVSAP